MPPIADRTGLSASLTEGDHALALFTDRHDAIRRFCEYLNDEPAPGKILFFHGDGGNGKSLLLKRLRQLGCKRFEHESWDYIRQADDDEFISHLSQAETATRTVASARLDFSTPPSNEEGDCKEALDALFSLQRQLAKDGIRFHVFNFAVLVYLKKVGLPIKERLKKLPTEEGDVAAALESLLEHTSTGKLGLAVVKWLDKYTGETLQRWMQSRQINPAMADEIANRAPEDLFKQLPELFAADLNASLANAGRVALLLDSHEALWGVGDRQLSDELFFAKDEWLRLLLSHLALEHGVVAVVAGREPPRWAEADHCPIPIEFLEMHHIRPFRREDADLYLQRADVQEETLRAAIIDQCAVPDEGYHPLYLGLCADIVLAATRCGTPLTADTFHDTPETSAKSKQLLNRLLRYVDQDVASAVRALAACRAFDFEIFQDLGRRLHFHVTRSAFDMLVGFSFVRRMSDSPKRFRIHSLIRHLLRDLEHEDTRNAHQKLEAHYREKANQGDMTAIAEAIYHLNRIDPAESVTEWVNRFDQALRVSLYPLCALLLEVRSEMYAEGDFQKALMGQHVGNYYQTLSHYDNARQEYQNAIADYAKQLERTPDDVDTLNNQANALARLGDLQAMLSQHDAALESYQNAITAYSNALQYTHNDTHAFSLLNNKAVVLAKLGELQATRTQHNSALESYKSAISIYDALQRTPDDVGALSNQGNVLTKLGDLQVMLSQHDALERYKNAITIYATALQHAPNDVGVLSNQGSALSRLGDLQVMLDQDAALESYKNAITTYANALQHAPDHATILSNWSNSLTKLGDLQAMLGQHDDALESYKNAITAAATALRRAPDYVNALNNQGLALKSLGDLQVMLSQHNNALESYKNAITAYANALQHAPNDVVVLNNQSLALVKLGDLQTEIRQPDAACQSWRAALQNWKRSLELAPNQPAVYEAHKSLKKFYDEHCAQT